MPKIALITTRNKKLLLVQEEGVFQLPGGKADPGESELECLHREVEREELPGCTLSQVEYYKKVQAQHPQEEREVEVITYKGELQGELQVGDIQSFGWYGAEELASLPLSDATEKVITYLKEEREL